MSQGTIQSVIRCLDILEKLSANNGSSIFDIAVSTGLPRGTVHRMLETLSTAGYVRKDNYLGAYWLEAKAGSLGKGYIDQSWILDGGSEVIGMLRKDIHWCLKISVPDGDVMTTRIATRLKNPQGGTKTFAGEHKLIGQCCEGHVYLAHCAPDIREQTLDRMYGKEKEELKFLINGEEAPQENTRKLLTTIKKQGYALYEKNYRTSTVGIPILKDDDAFGVLSMTYFTTGMSDDQLVKEFVPRLQDASRQITRQGNF